MDRLTHVKEQIGKELGHGISGVASAFAILDPAHPSYSREKERLDRMADDIYELITAMSADDNPYSQDVITNGEKIVTFLHAAGARKEQR